ncbi:hypothetical protein ACSBR1_004061 [Camellia fascicularis]
MANDGHKEKGGNDIPTDSGKHVDPNMEEDGCNEETQDQNHEKKDVGQEGDVPKNQTKTGIITRTTSRYGKIDVYKGTKR